MTEYIESTRHSWSTLIFITPLLVAYEIGVFLLNRDHPEALRNGADIWMREALAQYGMPVLWAAPVVIFAILLAFALWNYTSRPKDTISVLFGMTIESAVYAAGIWALSRNFRPILDQIGIQLNISAHQVPLSQVVNFLGAGIYEEFLFRFGLFTLLCIMMRLILFPAIFTILIAGVVSSLIFSAAHHIPPAGETFVPMVFLFRTIVGIIFTLIYVSRGLGIAVGAHAGYNILVGPAFG